MVTKPFKFEGKRRATQAERGLRELQDAVDTMITIPNERLLTTVKKETSMSEAFMTADDVLRQAIQGISDLILVPGIINLDFADVKTIMSRMGIAIMGTGIASGADRAKTAATAAVSSPLLEDASVDGARGVIINVTGGPDLTLAEVSEASDIIYNAAHEEANIIFGAVVDPKMEGQIKITVIATGFDRARDALSPMVQSTVATPIDLTAYSAQRILEEERKVVNGLSIGAMRPAVTVTRRAGLDLPIAASASAVASSAPAADRPAHGELSLEALDEDASELDVPAFLRKQEG